MSSRDVASLAWTAQPPTVPGLYWARGFFTVSPYADPQIAIDLVRVVVLTGQVVIQLFGAEVSQPINFYSEYFGPLDLTPPPFP